MKKANKTRKHGVRKPGIKKSLDMTAEQISSDMMRLADKMIGKPVLYAAREAIISWAKVVKYADRL